ncbi:hypothetical protein BDR04DRAFT_1157494 [Suillus decipiens]|nr:hypothetical protein BDR04DRAFT_1157494 [Suillus decipiens]
MSIYHGTTHIQGTKTDYSIHNPVNATQNVLELVFHYLLENPNYPKSIGRENEKGQKMTRKVLLVDHCYDWEEQRFSR